MGVALGCMGVMLGCMGVMLGCMGVCRTASKAHNKHKGFSRVLAHFQGLVNPNRAVVAADSPITRSNSQ